MSALTAELKDRQSPVAAWLSTTFPECREVQDEFRKAAGAQRISMSAGAVPGTQGAAIDFWLRMRLISRPAENQRFLVSANIAHADQHCPSMIVSPRGEVLGELPAGQHGVLRQVIDLEETGSWYLGQRRQDVLLLNYHGSTPPPVQHS
ncbi:nitrilase-related carbon-nitrogen hydrolase [Actinoplanes sp. NPDC051851]|uniref:nitrilase-related carbon-nitrogen hydrolase n=1 Tax=Actinoplanes sp. NPDC051851 TaxID=3154753 RepID=UPI00343EC60F